MTYAYKRLLTAIVLIFALTACNDTAVQKTAKALRDTEKAISTFQEIVINARSDGKMSEDDTRVILTATAKIKAAGHRAELLLRLMEETGAGDPKAVANVLSEVSLELDTIASEIRIGDEKLRLRVATTIQVAQLSLNAAKLFIGGGA
jgi:hypothetical protein